ncbi:fatty acid desaturase 2-like isoform X2 [Haliotis rufescens]|uniref:fatty acid desaturase 2-like isoform X2 n=1 Tax=Haliotis rufescens TaxID=6454 RepID=UPI001EB0996B|nr:fatty acid desaturase 2-like isoform X2 [Haliotis rufescens]
MGRGGKAENGTRKLGVFSVEEVTSHNKADDKWLIINGNIYDITTWAKKHPGGAKVISHYAGEDATDAWVAFHKDREFVQKYMKALQIGVVKEYKPAQAGWTQHDYGHLSVFKSNKLNHWAHNFVIGFIKGASSHWWNFRHNQHHCKPNILKKDPDIEINYLFLLGDYLPVSWGRKKKGVMPYNFQHNYFFLLGPPLLLPIYFHLENFYFVFKRKDWWDLMWTTLFFMKLSWVYSPLLGHWGTFWFYMLVRMVESHWFVWVTQMSHLPNEVEHDKKLDWVHLQLATTSNAEPSTFNDWFTGHLNYQIEHHLFPTMPRHNYAKVMPLVKSLCKKHGVTYRCKTLYRSFADIYWSLKKSGQLWYDAYHE